jgi:iron complex outermembrane recepter protein
MTRRALWALALLAPLWAAAPVLAQTTQELKRMTLQDLLDIPITTVSRAPDETADVPAAVYVITQDDIRRSGATSIPELLRLVPGLQVARINGGTWAIGIRGFADRLARSMLVLIDGRSVYSPLFAGTYWETQDVLLEDIDRIEVIRGPGGTLWGANAVNGIINIITKPAAETQGTLLTAGAGTEDRGFGAVRYGATSGRLTYRAYVKGFDRGPEFHGDGDDYDGWRAGLASGRADWTLADGRSLTLQGSFYDGRLGEQATLATYASPYARTLDRDAPLSGGHVRARFTGAIGGAEFQLQAYYDRTNRDEIPVGEKRDTADVDFQETLRRWPLQTFTWGAGYRISSGLISAVGTSAFSPPRRTDNLFSAFADDQIALGSDRWLATLGAKLEHNDYTGVEVQPTARLLWAIDPRSDTGLWWSVTRAVRTPSRVETDYTTTSDVPTASSPTFVRLLPNPSFTSEELVAYETGFRSRAGDRVYLTFSAFYNRLHDLLSTDLLTPFVETTPGDARLILPVMFRNGIEGNSHGFEATGDVRATPWWRLTLNYSHLAVAVTKEPGSTDVSQEARYEGLVPHHQLQFGNSVDLPGGWSATWLLRRVSALSLAKIPAYTSSDLSASRLLAAGLEVSVVGRDLFQKHVEWASGTGNVAIQPSVYARVTWQR